MKGRRITRRRGFGMDNDIQGRPAHVAAIRERAEAEMRDMGVDAAFTTGWSRPFTGAC